MQDLVKGAGIMVFASSRGNEQPVEFDQHGAFTDAVLEALVGIQIDIVQTGKPL